MSREPRGPRGWQALFREHLGMTGALGLCAGLANVCARTLRISYEPLLLERMSGHGIGHRGGASPVPVGGDQ